MANVTYRQLRDDEIAEAADVYLESVANLIARNGLVVPGPPREGTIAGYRHVARTGIFYGAELDGRLVAVCNAVVRGSVWFLSGFWALPSMQNQRIGGPLLRMVMAEGERQGARTFFTWSSIDLSAMASYMKLGMLPGFPILTFEGAWRGGSAAKEASSAVIEPLSVDVASAIDVEIRGGARDADHAFWMSPGGPDGHHVRCDGKSVGYFYVSGPTVGPAAWSEPSYASAVLEAASAQAARATGRVRMVVPGINHAAIRFAYDAGLSLVSFAHFLSTGPFGKMEQYLSSGPLLF